MSSVIGEAAAMREQLQQLQELAKNELLLKLQEVLDLADNCGMIFIINGENLGENLNEIEITTIESFLENG
jgi:hypothetical protein